MSESHRGQCERQSALSLVQRPRTHHVPAMPLPNTFETPIPNSPETRSPEPCRSLRTWPQGSPSEAQATGTVSDLPPFPGFADSQPPDRALQPSAQSPRGLHSNTSSLTCIRSLFQNFLHLQLRPHPGSQQDTCDRQAHELSGVGPVGPSPPLPDHSWQPPATS